MPASHKESPLSREQMRSASKNYLRCLNLSPNSQILIIGDSIGKHPDDDILTRAYISAALFNELGREHQVAFVKFDDSIDYETFRRETYRTLRELNSQENDDKGEDALTIIYLGDSWKNRSGMYHAAEDYGNEMGRNIRWAGSLGLTTGDARVMSELTPERMETIKNANQEFGAFFKERPRGVFEVMTRGDDGVENVLYLSYDTVKAPFESDIGQFDEDNKVMISDHVQYINIPGGEKFATPYPFHNTFGQFAAEGMLFEVENGMVIDVVELRDGAKDSKDPRQKELIDLVQSGKRIPVSELGLGYYALVGIKTYSDSSILSKEKGGPHIGFAHAPARTVEEKDLADASGDFHHTDFVLENPVLIWTNLKREDRQQLYPPVKN